ncbi:MAG: hypothetical protein MI974_16240 [Chitinophagales bacterium]|nr:hypothetical protein [Chitinophagales bacterium]
MHSTTVFALLLCLFGINSSLSAQQQIVYLENPSFEGTPRHGTPPPGWFDAGFEGESPPDTHPSGDFGVEMKPAHGNTYLGMVVRENETYERIGQILSMKIKKGQCYQMEVAVTRSKNYLSPTVSNPDGYTNFSTPCVLRVLGGTTNSDDLELLAIVSPIKGFEWEYYLIDILPNQDCDYLYLEAFYVEPVMFPYNGNILVDDLSPIVPCELLEEGLVPRDFEIKDP